MKSDLGFDMFFPGHIRNLSTRHWTPFDVTIEASAFLADAPGKYVLDIGSGIGKFCLLAAMHHPEVNFHGIEQREELVKLAKTAKNFYQIPNAHFIHGNFTELNLDDYDHFYFFNSFFENIDDSEAIDSEFDYSLGLFNYYSHYLSKQLNQRPPGTRLATFDVNVSQIPASYKLVKISKTSSLKMWEKR